MSTIHFNSNSLIWSDGRRQIAVNALTPDEWDCLRSIQNIAGGIYPYAMARRLESDDFIYYLKDTRSGLTKVGRSVNPKARLKEVKRKINRFYGYQDAIPFSVSLCVPQRLAELIDTESAYHFAYAGCRRVHPAFPNSLEWFGLQSQQMEVAL